MKDLSDHYIVACNHNISFNLSRVAKQQATNSHPLLLSDFLFSQCFSLCSTYSVLIVQYLSLRFFLWKVIFFREKFKIKSTLEKLTNSWLETNIEFHQNSGNQTIIQLQWSQLISNFISYCTTKARMDSYLLLYWVSQVKLWLFNYH